MMRFELLDSQSGQDDDDGVWLLVTTSAPLSMGQSYSNGVDGRADSEPVKQYQLTTILGNRTIMTLNSCVYRPGQWVGLLPL